MISAAMSRRAEELTGRGTAFVTATVVRAQRPTSVRPGSVALVLDDGTIEGFVGGVCTEHSVRAYSLQAMRTGEPVLLRIVPFDELESAHAEGATDPDGAVTVQNPCLSGGAVEIFLEPVLPAPRLLVVGETPIAAAILRIGPELGFSVLRVEGADLTARPGDLALVVAAHGRDELHSLRVGLEAGLPYVGLVASRKRGDGVLAELRGDGVPDELLVAHRRPGRPGHRRPHTVRDRALDPGRGGRRPASPGCRRPRAAGTARPRSCRRRARAGD